MKQNLTLLVFFFFTFSILHAQGISINADGAPPDASAILDVQSSTKGILIPRMNLLQRNGISSPVAGLMIYQTDNTPGLYIYIGTAWKLLASASNVWTTAGNGGMDPNTQFIGTTDNIPLRFRVNNKWAGELNPLNASISLGDSSGISTMSFYNTSFGHKSLRLNQNGNENTAVGYEALSKNNVSFNVAVGYWALRNNETGTSNTAVGNKALEYNTVGSWNTAVGRWALNYNVEGYENTSVGFESLGYNISGYKNTALGAFALEHNDNGIRNTAIGNYALNDNTTGDQNTAVGDGALENNTAGNQNCAVGAYAMRYNIDGLRNTAQGYGALESNTTGDHNIAIGYWALGFNETGINNTAVGTQALSNTLTSSNTAVGYKALYQNTYGNLNTALGSSTLESNVNGIQNVALGSFALYASNANYNTAIGSFALGVNTTGANLTAIGRYALLNNTTGSENTAIGGRAMEYNSTGSYNVAVGMQSLENNTTGNYNIAIGAYSGTLSSNLYNTVGISNTNILHQSNNQVVIGNTSHVWIGGQVGWSTYSDARLKTDIREDVKGLDFINRLHPVTYHRDIDAQASITGMHDELEFPNKYDIEQIKFSGFLAQEVEQAAIASGYEFSGITVPKDEHSVYSLSYESFVVPLVKAVQEQQTIIEELMRKMEVLEKRMIDLKAEAKAEVKEKAKRKKQ